MLACSTLRRTLTRAFTIDVRTALGALDTTERLDPGLPFAIVAPISVSKSDRKAPANRGGFFYVNFV
jgi:hypothetical protein